MFGYIAFAAGTSDEQLTAIFEAQNILSAPFHRGDSNNIPNEIYIALVCMCVVVACTCPFTILPSKDSIEEGLGRRISNK